MGAPCAREDNKVAVTCGRSIALTDLNAAIEQSGHQDKALAQDCGVSRFTFSRMRAGVQAFGVGRLDDLPAAVRVDFCRRQLARDGYEIRRIDPVEIAEELWQQLDKLGRLVKLHQIARGRPVKAESR